MIVFDAATPDDSYVIMGFDDYAAGFDCECNCGSDCGCGSDCECDSDACSEKFIPETKTAALAEAPQNIPVIEPVKADLSSNSEENQNLTEEDLTDKINREISMWKNRDNSVFLGEENKPKKAWAIPSKVKDKAQDVE